MRIAMVGSGYVGLVSGACFADFGHRVVCVDKDADRIAQLQAGHMPIYEPGLDALVAHNVAEKRLSFTTDLTQAVKEAEAIFVAVGTPSRRGDGHADLTYVFDAIREVIHAIEGFKVIIIKSTVPLGTGDLVEIFARKERLDADFAIVSNPEFLREGAAISDFKHPNRIVVGLEDDRARHVMQEIYRPLCLNAAPIMFTTRRSSELIKYASNAFLATKIAFINEIADLCERAGADVQEVARGIGLDHRIGPKFLHAGPGYGGSCFPKDTRALLQTARQVGAPLQIVEAVVVSNETRKSNMAARIAQACDGSVMRKEIAILGLSFKPNTDDMRESPAIDIVAALHESGAIVRAYDPAAMEQARKILTPHVRYYDTPYDCVKGADALVIVTEWDAFRALDLKRIKESLKTPILVDMRNIYDPNEVTAHGFHYFGVGRSSFYYS